MRKLLLVAFLLIFPCSAFAEDGLLSAKDRALVEASLQKQSYPDTTSILLKAEHLVRLQMAGQCYYEPECPVFFVQSVRELGLVGAIFATADRSLRCTQIGTLIPLYSGATFPIHEGPEAYKRKK